MLSRHRVRHHRCKTAIRRVPRCAVTRCMRVPPARAKSRARRCAPGRSGRPSSSTRTLAVCAVRASIRTWQSRHRVWHVMLANFETPIRQRHPRLTHVPRAIRPGSALSRIERASCAACQSRHAGRARVKSPTVGRRPIAPATPVFWARRSPTLKTAHRALLSRCVWPMNGKAPHRRRRRIAVVRRILRRAQRGSTHPRRRLTRVIAFVAIC